MIDLSQFEHFHFLRPWWLLAIVPLLMCLLAFKTSSDPVKMWKNVISKPMLHALLVGAKRNRWLNPLNVSFVVAVLATLIAAGPTWKQQPSPFSEDIAPLIIALDASQSMLQQDVQPSRLERAKQKIEDLIELRKGSRTGLIVYAGTAHTVIPLTNDSDVLRNFLSAVSHQMMPRQGKSPERALRIADKMLKDATVPGTVMFFADGVGPQSETQFEQYFDANPRQLIVYGVGQAPADTQSLSDESYLPLEQEALQRLAAAGNGFYQSMSIDDTDMRRVSYRINNHIVIVDDESRPWEDAGYYLVFPLALLYLLWFRKGWTLSWCIPFLVVLLWIPTPQAMAQESDDLKWRFADIWMTRDQQGQWLMQQGDYEQAAQRFDDIYWQAVAYYRAENFKAAAELFSRIDTVDGVFNMGNAYAHGREYLKARAAYDRVLAREPGHVSAQKNRALIQEIIDSINLMSQSQKAEEGEAIKDLPDDEPQTAEGDERQVFVAKKEIEQFTAEEILNSDSLNETWMRQVQKDPARFLSIKFQMQLKAMESAAAVGSEGASGGQR